MPDWNASSTPVYSDRKTDKSFADATSMINHYLACFTERAKIAPAALDEAGHVQLTRGSAAIGINVLEEQGVLMIFSPVMDIPVTGREALYRRLLELSFVATSDAAFAIDGQRGKVVLRALRRLSGLDYEEFEDLVVTVGQVADEWDDRLIREFGT